MAILRFETLSKNQLSLDIVVYHCAESNAGVRHVDYLVFIILCMCVRLCVRSIRAQPGKGPVGDA